MTNKSRKNLSLFDSMLIIAFLCFLKAGESDRLMFENSEEVSVKVLSLASQLSYKAYPDESMP